MKQETADVEVHDGWSSGRVAVYLEAEQRAEIQRIAKAEDAATASQVHRAALEYGGAAQGSGARAVPGESRHRVDPTRAGRCGCCAGSRDCGAMTDGVTVLFGAVGAVAAILAVLVPVIRAQGAALRREIEGQGASLCREIDTLRADVGEARRDLHILSDRVARIEGALSGPWRPNGGPSNPVEPTVAPRPSSPESAT